MPKPHAGADEAQSWCAYSPEKFVVQNDGTFDGRALTFGTPDANYGFTFEPDCFDVSLEARGADGVRMLYEHQADQPVGAWREIRRDDTGLFVRGKLALATERAGEIKALMSAGALDGLSIGFIVQEQDGDHIIKADLMEISIVAFPADASARLGMDALRHYSSNSELPKAVKAVLPGGAQTVYRKSFNQYAAAHPDAPASRANALAWRAVRKEFSSPHKEAGMWVSKIKHDEHHPMAFSDIALLDGVRRTADGYLTASARVARAGIQLYSGAECGRPEQEFVRVYRPEEEVKAGDALKSFAHRPVTVDHPSEMVNSANWKDYAVGQTGDEVVYGDGYVRVPLVLMDAAAIKSVEGGKRELSMGYTTELKWTPGKTADGEDYDAVQTAIRGNHLAIVTAARGGSNLRIGDDQLGEEGDPEMPELKLTTVEVDGLPVECTDASAAILRKTLSAMSEKLAKLAEKTAEEIAAEKEAAAKAKAAGDAALATKDAEIETLKKQLEDAHLSPAAVDALVKDRSTLIGRAKVILGDALVVDGREDADIRKQCVVAKVGDVSKDWSDDQIKASFNTLAADKSKTKDFAAAISDSQGTSDAREKAYDDYDGKLTSAWKTRAAA